MSWTTAHKILKRDILIAHLFTVFLRTRGGRSEQVISIFQRPWTKLIPAYLFAGRNFINGKTSWQFTKDATNILLQTD